MRPKFVMILLFMTLAFLLMLLITPGLGRRKAVTKAMATWIQNQTPENEQAIQRERDKARRNQYAVCGLGILNVAAIIVYGTKQRRKLMG